MLLLPLSAALRADADDEAPLAPPAANPPARVEREELARGAERRLFNLYVGVDIVSQYVSRGLVYLDEPSLQPWLELDVPLLDDPREGMPLDSLTLFGGTWNNVNVSGRDDGVARTGRAAELDDWYEADVYGGLRARVTEHLSTSLRYNYYTSPSGDFDDIHELDWRVSFDDASLWPGVQTEDDVGLYPALRVAKEVRDEGGADGWYFQPSLRPSWRVSGLPLPVVVQVPLVLGFGADGQYLEPDGDERHFGFFGTGLAMSIDLDLLPERRGSITLSLALDHLVLADDDLGFEGEGSETVGRAGLSYGF